MGYLLLISRVVICIFGKLFAWRIGEVWRVVVVLELRVWEHNVEIVQLNFLEFDYQISKTFQLGGP